MHIETAHYSSFSSSMIRWKLGVKKCNISNRLVHNSICQKYKICYDALGPGISIFLNRGTNTK